MAEVTESDVIDGVYVVQPTIHGDERGIFIETYRREWFPQGREMIQGNRGNRQAGAVVGLHYHLHQADYWYVPIGSARVVLHDLREGSPTDGKTLTLDLGRGPTAPSTTAACSSPGRRARLRRAQRHGHHVSGRRLLQPQGRARGGVGRPGHRRRLGCDRPDALRPRPAEPGPSRSRRRAAAALRPPDVTGRRILVTGGAGFIGSNYVRHVLATTDDAVTVYDALTYAGNLSTLRDVDDDPRYQFVKGNICDPETLEDAMRSHDTVVHFAAESHVDRSIVGPDDFIHTNCFGTNVVMDTARRLGIARVVHIGTDEVYGSVETGSSAETDPLEPRSPYSASKAGSDLIALSYHHTYGLPVSVTRCTNNFGPYQYPEKAIPLFTTNLLDGGRIPLYGDGLNERDWIFVDDHCAGVQTVLDHGEDGEIYNIGAGNETPNRVLVDKLLTLLGKGEESVQYVTDRLGHDRRYSVDISRVTALGWRRVRTLDEALEATVAWYRDNRWWWEPLKQPAG